MATHQEAPGSAPPDGRPKCPNCGCHVIRTTTVPWYPELEYLTCDTCQRVWTVERKRRGAVDGSSNTRGIKGPM